MKVEENEKDPKDGTEVSTSGGVLPKGGGRDR